MGTLAEYTVAVEGRKREVRLLEISNESAALLDLDGEPFKMSFQKLLSDDAEALVNVNDRSYRIKLRRNDRPSAVSVEVEGEEFIVEFQHSRKKMGREDAVAGITAAQVLERERIPTKKKGAVTSILPGRVVLLKVKEGDGVKAGDPLCILEAMKMENEIIASSEGTVKEVRAKLGSIVGKGEVLFVIE